MDRTNEYILNSMEEGEIREYYSTDSVAEDELNMMYQPEYLNSIKFGGIPPHRLNIPKDTNNPQKTKTQILNSIADYV